MDDLEKLLILRDLVYIDLDNRSISEILNGVKIYNDINRISCKYCGNIGTYGSIFDEDERLYRPMCKECFKHELEFFISPPCNIKPAKR